MGSAFRHVVGQLFWGRRHEALAFKSADPVSQSGVLGVSNYSAKLIPKLVKPREKPFPGRPPYSPTLPEILPKFAFGPPSAELLSFFVVFCTPQKSLKNRIPQNTSQKLSKSTCFAPLAAQNRFLMIRVSILASFWHPFFIKKSYFFENRQKHENLIKPMKNQ